MSATQIRGSTQITDATVTTPKLSMTTDLDMVTHKITNVVDPVNPQDAATRAWVLANVSGGIVSSISVKAATTANITLSGTQTIDGIALSVNDTVLVKDQSTQSGNGLYTVASGAWTRMPAMDTWAEVPGMLVSVQQGTSNADTVWLSTADAGGSLGTTAITFTKIPSLGAGNFITRETPTGTINGSNTTFTLANTPVSGTEQVFLNGLLQEPGAGNDYTISAATITYLTAPATGDRLRVNYLK
jgi:hypothetical protein